MGSEFFNVDVIELMILNSLAFPFRSSHISSIDKQKNGMDELRVGSSQIDPAIELEKY